MAAFGFEGRDWTEPLNRRELLLGTAAAIGAAALPAMSLVKQYGWTEFGVPVMVYREGPLVIDGEFPPPSPEIMALLERRIAAAQEAFDVAVQPIFDELFSSESEETCPLARLVA